MTDIVALAQKVLIGEKTGIDLATMVQNNELSKADRRKISKYIKIHSNEDPSKLSDRQKLRLAVKEKKKQPRLSADERRKKYLDAMRDKQAAKSMICLACRRRGHLLKDCPNEKVDFHGPLLTKGADICFNCGSKDHTLKDCKKHRDPGGALKFATCFVCKLMGHISKDCPSNPNGLYPNGGCCHICLLKTHLVKDCPQKREELKAMDNDQMVVKARKGDDSDKYIRDDELDFDEY